MKSKYLYTKTTVSLIRYHFVFCPRYRRKIFLVDGVEERFKQLTREIFKQLTREICEKNGFEILAMECHIDHVHLFTACGPTWSPSDIMKTVKGASSLLLRKEFPALSAMPSLWTRSFFVSTAGDVSAQTIQRYVETQKTRP